MIKDGDKTNREHTISIDKEALQELEEIKEGKEEVIEEKHRVVNLFDTINGEFDVFGNQ